MTMALSACGGTVTDTASDNAADTLSEDQADTADTLTEDQAYTAVINYCKATVPGFSDEMNTEGFIEYWDVSTNDAGEIVVLYRSYTAAQTRYYIDPVTGEAYVTELVPGIIDEEQKTGETFNAWDFLDGSEQQADETISADEASIPVEYETSDGFMGSFLLASDRDLIDTTNDYGEFYRVVYEASLEGDELTACGSMDYRNSREQDPIIISSDVKHVFKVNDNTVYLKGGEESTLTVSKEEFAELLDSRKNSGMFIGIEIKDGVVMAAELFAQ